MIINTSVDWRDSVTSTNDEAKTKADTLSPDHAIWVAAKQQTAGRGRRGRVWQTGNGDAYLTTSVVLIPDKTMAELGQVSFVAALAVKDMLEAIGVSAQNIQLKWPNDVLIDGQKVAGILLESGQRLDGQSWLVVGIGVNLADNPSDVTFPATHVGQHAPAPLPEQSLVHLSESFKTRYNRWAQFGFDGVRSAWQKSAWGLGAMATTTLGDQQITGTAMGLDEDGALQLQLESGQVRSISAGEVFFSA